MTKHNPRQRRNLHITQRPPLRLRELTNLLRSQIDMSPQLTRNLSNPPIHILATQHKPIRRPTIKTLGIAAHRNLTLTLDIKQDLTDDLPDLRISRLRLMRWDLQMRDHGR